MSTTGLPDWPWATTPVDDLPAAERLLLDAIRAWGYGITPLTAARLVLAAAGVERAAPALDALLRRTSWGLAPPLAPLPTPDEAVLVLVCGVLQRGDRSTAVALLARVLPLSAVSAAMPPAMEVGVVFRRGGLLLRPPRGEKRRRYPHLPGQGQ